jgi:hypothetical protein
LEKTKRQDDISGNRTYKKFLNVMGNVVLTHQGENNILAWGTGIGNKAFKPKIDYSRCE